jgi:hypothetical protein
MGATQLGLRLRLVCFKSPRPVDAGRLSREEHLIDGKPFDASHRNKLPGACNLAQDY